MERDGIDVGELRKCCVEATEVRDSKDYKPYVQAALRKLEELLNLEVYE